MAVGGFGQACAKWRRRAVVRDVVFEVGGKVRCGRRLPPAMTAPVATSFLAFDFGLKSTDVATGNRITRSATPQGVIRAEGKARWPLVAERIAQWQPDALVVGVPFHPEMLS